MATQDQTAPLIAVDMDDTLSLTNVAVAQWHNRIHGTSMTIQDVHYFHYWKNEHWGSQEETFAKLAVFYNSPDYASLSPVPYAFEALRGLKELGFRFKIVTARSHQHRDATQAWIDRHFPNLFEEIIFTSTYATLDQKSKDSNPWSGKSKAEVIKGIGAVLLIDDSLENATVCAREGIHVLLFGDNEWSKRNSGMSTPIDKMSRSERVAAGDVDFWIREIVEELPPLVRRVGTWKDVVEWVKDDGEHVVQAKAPLEELEALGKTVRTS